MKNIVAALRFLPQKIIFVGFKEVMKKKRINDLIRFFRKRKQSIDLEFEFVERYDYNSVIERLRKIVENNEDCCFDLTGGKELILAAMGEISSEKQIPMVQFNVRTGNMIRIKNCEGIEDEEKSCITIEECVSINGGAIVTKTDGEPEWNLTESFKADIEAMWRINSADSSAWNRFSKTLATLAKNELSGTETNFEINLRHMEVKQKEDLLNPNVFDELRRSGLILDYSLKNEVLRFRIKNTQVFRCIIKAGNILELYTYMVAIEITEQQPGFYDDIKMGVIVDWDGVENSKFSSIKDTRNEIDVFLMCDLVPVFISCKNGDVNKEALYELNTVAEKFGGEYAKKVLMATFISRDADKKRFLLQRAKDMNIEVIENIDVLSKEAFKREMRKRIK